MLSSLESHPLCCTDVELTSGTLDLDVSFHGVPIYFETQDLCKDTTCPLKKGPYEIHVAQYFPPITPPVRFCFPYKQGISHMC